MNEPRLALLPDRGVIGVTGADAERLLQGVVTNDLQLLARQPALFAALLTPQGKLLAEFFVVKAPDGVLLDISKDRIGEVLKRLAMYRLRAKVELRDRSGELAVAALWSGTPASTGDAAAFMDPRDDRLGMRLILRNEAARTLLETTRAGHASAADYDAHRIALGVPEGGRDYPLGDTFPHEANLDRLHGISFSKGCYVGQELVARMQHKTVVRKRVVRITGDGPLAGGAEVKIGEATIGTVGSVAGDAALALVRLDRVAEALDKGLVITAGGIAATIDPDAVAAYRAAVAART